MTMMNVYDWMALLSSLTSQGFTIVSANRATGEVSLIAPLVN